MKTEDEGEPGQITPEQYRELRALFEYWFDRLESPTESEPRQREQRESREVLRARLADREANFEVDVLRIRHMEGYHAKLRTDLRTIEPLFDCLESKLRRRPVHHCMWHPLLTALEEWKAPLYENLPGPDPLKPLPWAPGARSST